MESADRDAQLTLLGTRLKTRRQERGLAVRALASTVSITPAYLWMLEAGVNPKTGRPSRPSVDLLERLALELDLPPSELFAMAGYPGSLTLLPNPADSPMALAAPGDGHKTVSSAAQRAARGREPSQRLRQADGHRSLHGLEPLSPSVLDQQGPPFDDGLFPQPDPFIGRDGDLAWLLGRLRGGQATAITALGGMGGIGKTALAARAVHLVRQEGRFHDGIAVVLCQGLTDPSEVLREVLARFDPWRRQPDAADLARLTDWARHLLEDKEVLVVLDNVEPDLPLTGVTTPLRAAGAVLLLTARHALPRAAIPVDASRQLGLLAPDEALDLFARSYGSRVVDLAPAAHVAVERITTALGRHTLAIKLAGAYAADVRRDLSVLADELEEPARAIGLPEGEAADAVKRVFAPSLASLPLDAQRLFVAVAAFATNKFGRKAVLALAKAMGSGTSETSVNVLVLRALVDASTNAEQGTNSDRERLRVHPLLRAVAFTEFARWPQDQLDTAHRAVAQYYTEAAQDGDDAGRAVDEMNIIGALEWAHSHAEDAMVAQICSGMQDFWRNRGHTTAGLHYLPWGIAAHEAHRDRPSVVPLVSAAGSAVDTLFWLLLSHGRALQLVGRLDEATLRFESGLALARESGERDKESAALALLGKAARERGQLIESEHLLRAALDAARAARDVAREGSVLRQLGQVARDRGRLREALQALRESLQIARSVQDRRGEAAVLTQLGRVLLQQGRPNDAEAHHRQALHINRDVHDRQGEGVALGELGRLAQQRGLLDHAQELYEEALAIAREVQDRRYEGRHLSRLGQVAQVRGQLNEAERLYEEACAIHQQVQDRRYEGVTLERLGQVAHRRGQLDEAERSFQQALAIAHEVQDRQHEATLYAQLGQGSQRRGRLDEAERYFQQALGLDREVQDRRAEGIDLSRLGRIAERHGRFEQAKLYYLEALEIHRKVQSRPSEAIVLAHLGQLAQQHQHLDEAEDYLQQALEIARAVHDRQGEGIDLALLGDLAFERGHVVEAEAAFQQSLEIHRSVQDRRNEGRDLVRLGTLAHLRGSRESASLNFEQALAIAREVQDRRGEGLALFHLATNTVAAGDLDAAERLYRESLAIARETHSDPDVAQRLNALGRFFVEQRGDRAAGRELLEEAAALVAALGLPKGREQMH
jgi:tetratricopeptide (TPR) repeat protein/transcriptional regulator with XRE-family HTH domain